MSKQTAEVLRAARALIEQPENWVTGALALTKSGELCGASSELACRFCAAGAILRCAAGNSYPPLIALCRAIGSNTAEFNDHATTTHADVLAVFDAAIAAEESTP